MKLITILILILFVVHPFSAAELTLGFYRNSCPEAERMISFVVQRHMHFDRSVVAGLLRLQLHDCFVNGCDASVLIDPTSTRTSEKLASPNLTLRGLNIIDEAKDQLEQVCPLTVSCADIIALATRDAVALANGPNYTVLTGRKDGLLSDPSLVNINIPGPFNPIFKALQLFRSKGLLLEDFVTLMGAHTVGFAHCKFFQTRLSSFQGNIDPMMDPSLDARLVDQCGSIENDPFVDLDIQTPFIFDNNFYKQILVNKGILQIDQLLALDLSTQELVRRFAEDNDFFLKSFINATIKMGGIDVLVGNEGEIRRNCRAFNHPI